MRLNERIIHRFEVSSNASREQIFDTIVNHKKKQHWTDLLADGSVDFKEITIAGDQLEIITKPGIFSGWRADGKITIDIIDKPDNVTTLKCEILPYKGQFPLRVGFLIVALSVWSLLLLVNAPITIASFMIVLASAVFGLIAYLHYVATKHQLIAYSKRVIKEVTRVRK